jgi:phospholipid/cholesterol/gamma-HCH transport system substrate-binding protein
MKIKREYTIALMVLAGVGLLIFGINYLKGLDLFQRRNVYHALYWDISGINESSPVYFNGFRIGQVIETQLMPDGSGRIAVSFQINEDGLKFPDDTKVQIYSADLFSRSLKLVLGTSAAPAQAGDTLIGDAQLSLTDAVSSQIDPLKRRAESMIANVDTLLTRLQQILNEDARNEIDAGFTSIRQTLDAFHRSAERIDALIVNESANISATVANLRTITNNLVHYNTEIVRILENMDTVTTTLARGDLDRMLRDMSATSAQLKVTMDRLEAGEGTLGALLHNDTLYRNLESASREMDLLLEDLRMNPKRYVNVSVFGRKDRQPQLSRTDVERIKDAIQEDVKP